MARTTDSLLAAIAAFLHRHAIDGPLVVAVSGGPDSVALLHALAALRWPHKLIAAHLNHLLRGPESDADEESVCLLSARLSVSFACARIAVAEAAAQTGENLESAARRIRYDWLGRIAQEHSARHVATGHTADDQAETVLHHIARGTGLRGLRGIAPRRPIAGGVELVRPLLYATRAAVMHYLAGHAVPYRIDASNQDLSLTRNRIRIEVLPYLERSIGPGVAVNLARLAEHAQALQTRIDADASAVLQRAERPRAGELIVLDAASLQAAERYLAIEALHALWERENWPLAAMDSSGWERLGGLLDGAAGAVDLPDGVHARRKGSVLQLARTVKKGAPGS